MNLVLFMRMTCEMLDKWVNFTNRILGKNCILLDHKLKNRVLKKIEENTKIDIRKIVYNDEKEKYELKKDTISGKELKEKSRYRNWWLTRNRKVYVGSTPPFLIENDEINKTVTKEVMLEEI